MFNMKKEVTLHEFDLYDLKKLLAQMNADDTDYSMLEMLLTKAKRPLEKIIDAFEDKPAEVCSKLFVYGTLKVGGRFASSFDETRKSAVKATVEGQLWGDKDFTGYPMMFHGEGEIVHGELHEYDADMNELIHEMDRIEGFRVHDPEQSLFIRELINVTLEDGTTEKAWAYFFNGENRRFPNTVKHDDGVWQLQPRETTPTDEVRDGDW